jgi:uncharacterized protein (TIGR03435 family)
VSIVKGLSYKILGGCFVVLLGMSACVRADAQDGNAGQESPLRYDVASIRPFKMTGTSFTRRVPAGLNGGTFEATGVTVEDLLYLAYGVRPDRIEGAPAWIGEDLYSVSAKADPALQQKLQGMSVHDEKAAEQQMLQVLLADRLQLRLHPSPKSATVYELSVAKSGFKLHVRVPEDPLAPAPNGGFSVRVDGETMLFQQCSMDRLVDLLMQLTQRDIVDKTDIPGKYNFALHYKPGMIGGNADPDIGDLQDALVSALGLDLKAAKGAVKSLVIEHIEKPSAN